VTELVGLVRGLDTLLLRETPWRTNEG